MTSTALIIIAIAVAALFATTIAFLVSRINRIGSENAELKIAKAGLEAKLEAQEKIKEMREEQRGKDIEAMKDAFKAISAENSESFKKKSEESIAQLLKPVQDKFGEFDKAVRDSREKSAGEHAAMKTLIHEVMSHSKTIGDEAKHLADALSGRSKVQGDFGEMILTDLLKNAGLEEGIHFVTQGVLTDEYGHEIKSETGATMIPDVVIHYPDDSEVVVDSKVSLTAFVNYMNAETSDDRERYAKAHIDSITRHIDELKQKDYTSYIAEGRKKVDYNIMFIPTEAAFRLMLDKAPRLWYTAKDNRVLIVSQMNLMIVLNMILMSWKEHDRQKNISEVYKTASELMSQLKNWMESYVKVGESLDKARSSYEDSKKKLMDSNQSVIRKIDKLEHLRVNPKRSNARIKTGGRIVGGQESVIPSELSAGLDSTEEQE